MYVIDKVPQNVMKENFETFCSKVGGDVGGEGGVFVILKDGKPNAALLSIAEYEDYKAMKNREYMAKIEESIAQINRGEVVTLTHDQLMAFEF